MAHYFDEQPRVASDRRIVDVALPDLAFTMETDRGVFSHGQVDAGTALLLREAPAPASSGHLLDLGCGAGAIALTLALRAPETTVWAVDTNERAVALAEHNANRNQIDNIRAVAPSQVPPDISFATIWSNPPIRVGKTALHELLSGWLCRLAAGGVAVLVVQKHLGADSLQRWLTDQGFPTERIASRAGFRLLRSTAAAETGRERSSASGVDRDP